MKILFLTPTPPFPTTDGARLIVAHLARELSKQHTLSLAALTDDETVSPELARYFSQVKLARRRVAPKWRKWGMSLFDEMPLWGRVSVSDELRAAVREIAAQETIEVVHLDTGVMATYLDELSPRPTVLALHDSLTVALQQRITHSPRVVERIAAHLQLQKMRRYEATQYARATRICVVTEREKNFLHSLAPNLPVRVIANGVDTNYFAPLPVSEMPQHVGFHGVMDYAPNEAAVEFFAREVMPRVWQEIPNATFTIIGRNPTRAVRALTRQPRIQVTGTVDDVRPCLGAQALIVAPMRDAGGIKNKILEAMAMGKAVVATPEAAEGIDARAGDEFVVGRDAAELAAACARLLRDDAERARLGKNARAWALTQTWEKTAVQYAALYQEAMEAARPQGFPKTLEVSPRV